MKVDSEVTFSFFIYDPRFEGVVSTDFSKKSCDPLKKAGRSRKCGCEEGRNDRTRIKCFIRWKPRSVTKEPIEIPVYMRNTNADDLNDFKELTRSILLKSTLSSLGSSNTREDENL